VNETGLVDVVVLSDNEDASNDGSPGIVNGDEVAVVADDELVLSDDDKVGVVEDGRLDNDAFELVLCNVGELDEDRVVVVENVTLDDDKLVVLNDDVFNKGITGVATSFSMICFLVKCVVNPTC